MKRALVTGGAGFLGSSIVRELLAEGVHTRVLALPGESGENLEGLQVEVVRGDVLSPRQVEPAVEGVDTVFHAAAVYEDWAPDPTRMYEVNVEGTHHVLEACRRAGVSRVVATSSITALGRPTPGTVGDEQTPYEAWDVDFAYGRTKYLSLRLAECFGRWGLDVRVVLPGIVLGPGDVRPTPSGKMLLASFLPGPAFHCQGGACYVDVRDAARVHVLAALRGRAGERYLAPGHNLTNLELARAIDLATGRRRLHVRLPVAAVRRAARALERRSERRGVPPILGAAFIEYGTKASFYSGRKAEAELGATFRPTQDTLRDAVAWFRARGRLP